MNYISHFSLIYVTCLAFVFLFEPVSCVPQCSAELIPIVGKKFNTLDEGIAFYDAYARAAGLDTRKHGHKASRELVTWQYLVCNRQGVKNGN